MNPKNYPRFIPWDLLLQPQAPTEDTAKTTPRFIPWDSLLQPQSPTEDTPMIAPSNPRSHNYETHADHKAGNQICRTICLGGLAACKTCYGAEGTLTTECPGVPMTEEQSDAVYAGKLDFRGGVWVEL